MLDSGMKLEIRHLALVLAIVEEGSVTKASHRLHLTQSALSHQLRDAEEKLGTPLFLRLNKKLVLTQSGQKVLNVAERIIPELKGVEEELCLLTSNGFGILRISTACYTCYHWLPRLLTIFNQHFPKIEVQIIAEATGQPTRALLEGRLDLAIVSARTDDRNLSFVSLFKDELVAIVHPKHPLAHRPYLGAKDFAAENLILYQVPKEETLFFRKVLLPAGISPKRVTNVQLTEAAIEMVKAGLGISVMARWAVSPQVACKSVRAVRITRKGLQRQWYAAVIKSSSTQPSLRKFIQLLESNPLSTIAGN
jgi:LysR family transcriptional regulator, regulator for metE and metH